jgi:hypothetical protein
VFPSGTGVASRRRLTARSTRHVGSRPPGTKKESPSAGRQG